MVSEESQKIIIEQLSQDLEDLDGFLRDLWHFLPLPVCYMNPLFIILDANSALENFFNLKVNQLIGQKAEVLFTKKSLAQKIFQKLSEKKKPLKIEGEVLAKIKKEVVISASLRQDSQGNIVGYYLAFSDISNLKKLQQNLEEKVRERTRQLEERLNELERFRRLTLGRELRMVELKKEIERLKKELGR